MAEESVMRLASGVSWRSRLNHAVPKTAKSIVDALGIVGYMDRGERQYRLRIRYVGNHVPE